MNVRQWRKRRTRKGKGTLRMRERQTEDDKVKERGGIKDEKCLRKQTVEKRKSSQVLKKRTIST